MARIKNTNVEVQEGAQKKACPGFFRPGATHVVLLIQGVEVLSRKAVRS
jgi:hypothetical protein